MRWIVLLAIVLIGLVLGGRHFLNAPVNLRSGETVSVEIPPGASARAIARKLREAGVVRSPQGFTVLVSLRGVREELKAGTYVFSPQESGRAIITRLVRGDTQPTDVTVTFPEGFTLAQIAARLEAQRLATKDAFVAAARAGRFRGEFPFLRDAPSEVSLEGYLFPDTYRFRRDMVVEEIVRRMLRRFDEQYARALRETGGESLTADSSPASAKSSAGRQLTAHQIVTMASIVEREVQAPEDRRLVAGILWRRFSAGMGLEADATVRYVTGDWERPLTVDDLKLDSPYNTRRYRGLPPGPIGNPGLDSLKAALAPQSSEYLYYLSASADGRTIFSRTLEEHARAKAEHLRP